MVGCGGMVRFIVVFDAQNKKPRLEFIESGLAFACPAEALARRRV